MSSIKDQLMNDVIALTNDGGRAVGTKGHHNARQHINSRLTNLGVSNYSGNSFLLPYGPSSKGFANVIAMIPGADPLKAPVLLGAHFDTCGDFPGADDNAAAVAILLAVAELLDHTERSVILAFFDAEEPPYFLDESMGSIRFYENQRTGPIHAAIILDLVGHDVPVKGLEDVIFITGSESDPGLEIAVRESEPTAKLRTVPTLNNYVGDLSDHHIFRTNERPYLMLTCGRWEHYHMPTDTPDKLNINKMEAVANYVVRLTNFISESRLDGPFFSTDPVETEIYFLGKNIMPTLQSLGITLPPLNSRKDIDTLIPTLISKFGL